MTAEFSPTAEVAAAVATTAKTYDVERDRKESVWTAASLIADGQPGKALYVLVRATERCARLSVADVDLVEAQDAYDEALTRHVEAFCVRRLRGAT